MYSFYMEGRMTKQVPDTQLSAWEEIQNSVEGKRAIVYNIIKNSKKGATLFEIQKALGWSVNRISGRVTELQQDDRIRDSGKRRANPESGRNAIVWEVV
jgi:hypothetical protein